MAYDITRMTLNVLNLSNSEYICSLTDSELGQWLRLICKAWLVAKECTLPIEEKLLRSFIQSRNVSPRVLESFPVVRTEFGDRRRNTIQYAEWLKLVDKSESSREAAADRWRPSKRLNSDESTNQGCGRIADAQPTQNERNANRTEQNITEHNKTSLSSVGSVLDEVQDQTPETDSCLKPGQPGYFKRHQYPGTSPKAVHKHFERAWIKVKGMAAVCRYPAKYPEEWERLCENHSADLMVPAFELWIQDHGQYIETQWPIPEFTKVAEDYMARVTPLNAAKSKITPEIIASTNAAAVAAHHEQFKGYYESKDEVEPKPAEGDLF